MRMATDHLVSITVTLLDDDGEDFVRIVREQVRVDVSVPASI